MSRFLLVFLVVALLGACGRRPPPDPEPAAQGPTAAQLAALVTYPKFADADPHSWDRRRPTSYPIHGIDVSRWQGEIDWRAARAAGVSFAYIKATEGGDLADPKFREYWAGAAAAGVPRGAYHYFYFCRPAEEQARWFIRNVPRDPKALPPVLDMEWTPHSPSCTLRPDGATVRREARKFIAMIEAHYGQKPVLYTTVDFYRDTGIGHVGGARLWLRSVAGHPHQVYPGAQWQFWQYSGTGLVPGIAGKVDLNVFNGGPDLWLRWSGQVN